MKVEEGNVRAVCRPSHRGMFETVHAFINARQNRRNNAATRMKSGIVGIKQAVAKCGGNASTSTSSRIARGTSGGEQPAANTPAMAKLRNNALLGD